MNTSTSPPPASIPALAGRRATRRAGALAAAASMMLVGCSSYRAPALQVVDAQVMERTSDGAVVQFTLEARNDNNNPLPLRQVKYSLDLNGQSVFTGFRSAEATLRQSGVHRFVLPAAVNAAALASLNGPASYRVAGQVTYVTPGAFAELLFDTGVRRPSASFTGEGSIEFPDSLGTLRAPGTPTLPTTPTPPTAVGAASR